MVILERVLHTNCYEFLACISNTNREDKVLDKMYGIVYLIYSYCYENFTDNALVIASLERISTAVKEPNLFQESQEKKEEDVHRSGHTTTIGMDLFNLYYLLDGCAKSFCNSYKNL
jgi:hypothetical protein